MDIKKTVTLSSVPIIFCSALFVYCQGGWLTSDKAPASPLAPATCNKDRPADPSLAYSKNPILQKLAEYEDVCHGAIVDELMLFTAMPQTTAEATEFAEDTAASLQGFSAHHITPLVLFEPSLTAKLDLASIHEGKYDSALRLYFETLRMLGVTDEAMGTWVLFPEANTPIWGTTDPGDFTKNVAKVGSMQKSSFPNSRLSVLLNSRSYPSHDTNWSHGELKSLKPYIAALPPDLVDRFGYQGFPSMAEANASHQYRQLDAHDFLPDNLAREAAELLHTNNIWINTGTFSRMYTDRSATEVKVESEERRNTLATTLEQAKSLQAQGFSISVNIFAEDKSLKGEHVDWSYWQHGLPGQGSDAKVFTWFVSELRKSDLGFSLYDHM